MAGEEPGRDSKEVGDPVLEVRKRLGFGASRTLRGCPFLLTNLLIWIRRPI